MQARLGWAVRREFRVTANVEEQSPPRKLRDSGTQGKGGKWEMGNGKWEMGDRDKRRRGRTGGHTAFRVAGPWPLWLPLTSDQAFFGLFAASRPAAVPLIRAKVTSNCCRRAKVPLGAQLDASPVKPESRRALPLPTPALRCRAARRCGVQGADSDSRCLSLLLESEAAALRPCTDPAHPISLAHRRPISNHRCCATR